MSHELRTPLNAIGGYTELLEMGIHGPVSDDQRDSLERIQRNQRHLLSLINQVLDYSEARDGNACGTTSATSSLAQALPSRRAARAAEDDGEGRCATPSRATRGLMVRADRDKLQQILLNLLTNATKFTASGGSIDVDCFADDATVYVDVRDTGVGIPERATWRRSSTRSFRWRPATRGRARGSASVWRSVASWRAG